LGNKPKKSVKEHEQDLRKLRKGMDWEFGISRWQIITYRTDKQVLLYSAGNDIQYVVIIHNRKEYKHIYIVTTESLCCTADINTLQQILTHYHLYVSNFF